MLSIALALAAASVAQQLAPASRGLVQCQMPSPETKACFSLSKIRKTGPASYVYDTELLVDPAGAVTATFHSPVSVRGSEVCQAINGRDIAGATFASQGQRLSGADAAAYRAQLRSNFAGMLGHTICTRVVKGGGGGHTVIGWIDGARIPAGDYEMMWVSRAAGWRVAP
ncbi:MAG TPA: hypothetical protein VF750_03605 [Sphingomicrobium sp.]